MDYLSKGGSGRGGGGLAPMAGQKTKLKRKKRWKRILHLRGDVNEKRKKLRRARKMRREIAMMGKEERRVGERITEVKGGRRVMRKERGGGGTGGGLDRGGRRAEEVEGDSGGEVRGGGAGGLRDEGEIEEVEGE